MVYRCSENHHHLGYSSRTGLKPMLLQIIPHNAFSINVSFSAPFIFLLFHSLADFSLLLHLLFLSPLPLSPLSLLFPSTSLSLTLKSTHCLHFSSFSTPTCWQEEKEEDVALYPWCVFATTPASAHCL